MISTAVFHQRVFTTPENTARRVRILRNRRSVRQNADRCLKQHPGGRDFTVARRPVDFSSQIQAAAILVISVCNPKIRGSQAVPFAGKNDPRKNSEKLHPATVRVPLELQEHTEVSELGSVALENHPNPVEAYGRKVLFMNKQIQSTRITPRHVAYFAKL